MDLKFKKVREKENTLNQYSSSGYLTKTIRSQKNQNDYFISKLNYI